MTIRSRVELKEFFRTGDIPSESNFADLIDSFALVGAFSELGYLSVGPIGSDADFICDGTDDQVQVQAAIDATKAIAEVIVRHPDGSAYTGIASRGRVKLLRGAYSISNTIDVKDGIILELTENAVLYPVTDVDVVKLEQGGGLIGGIITSAAYPAYTHTLIKTGCGRDQRGVTVHDVSLSGGIPHLATGLHLACETLSTSEADLNAIYGSAISNIWMSNLKIGLKLTQLYFNWVAGNNFSNITIIGAETGIHLEGDPNPLARGPYNNTFMGTNIELGVAAPLGVGIYCDGWQNSFGPVFIWDVGAGGASINFTSKSSKNRISGRLEVPRIDLGVLNVVEDWGS